MYRKVLVLAIAALQVSVFGSLLVWRVAEWNEAGWAGFAYHVDSDAELDGPVAGFFVGADAREIEMVLPGGPADRAGIVVGEFVETVDDIPVADLDGLRELAASLSTGDEVRYRIEGDAGSREVAICLEAPFGMTIVAAATVTSVFVGTVFLLISLLVYWGRPRSQTALVFFLMCVFGAAEFLMMALIEPELPSFRGIGPVTVGPELLIALGLIGFFSVALINSLLHLSLIFPRPRPVLGPGLLVWVHTFPFVLVVALGVAVGAAFAAKVLWIIPVLALLIFSAGSFLSIRLRRYAAETGWLAVIRSRPFSVQGLILVGAAGLGLVLRLVPDEFRPMAVAVMFLVAFSISMLSIFAYSVLIIINLFRSYRDSGADEKRQVRWPLWGTLTAVGGTFVVFIVSMVFSLVLGDFGRLDYTTNVALNTFSKLFYLLIPISLAFGIVKYRLMEIDVIIRKTVVYSAVTGFVLVVYMLLAGVSGLALVRSAGLESQAATVMATLLVVALFVPVRNRVQRVVDRFFFQREHDTEVSIARVTETVMQSASLDAMTLEVAEEVQQALRCRTVAVLVRRAGSDHFVPEATVGLPDTAVSGLSLPSADPVLIASTTVHVVDDGGKLSEDVRETLRRTAAERAVICRRGEEAVGLIAVGRKLTREPFDEGDDAFLEAVAGQLGVGLGRLRGRRAELEFAQALQIQRSLLPDEIPQIQGVEVAARWQPAREVSGDYYDVLRLADDRLAVCIGDVVGKGMPAALLMSSLQAAVKAVTTAGADPATVCDQVRSVVTSNLRGGKFVTFFLAIIDGASRSLTYTNCGQNQPVLVRRDGASRRLSEGGPAFARLMRDLAYRSGEVALEAGDRIVLFTDGVSEAESGEGEQFGEDGIVELVAEHRSESASELERTVSETVLAHAGGELQDDLTLVVLAIE